MRQTDRVLLNVRETVDSIIGIIEGPAGRVNDLLAVAGGVIIVLHGLGSQAADGLGGGKHAVGVIVAEIDVRGSRAKNALSLNGDWPLHLYGRVALVVENDTHTCSLTICLIENRTL